MKYVIKLLSIALLLNLAACTAKEQQIRIATYNVSIEASNYLSRDEIAKDPSKASIVSELLAKGKHPQLQNVAEVIQRTRPDILLLNEFDYIADADQGVAAFISNYLKVSQNDAESIDYPYFYIAPVNTGVATQFDLDNNGRAQGNGADAFGFGYYPGQYGMAVLSRFPIKLNKVRSLQKFLWKDMPDALITKKADGSNWYEQAAWSELRLSSKSHWDVPIVVNDKIIHLIASHPTPPTFDGKEDRNGKRNHDEIRLIADYLDNGNYLYDDQGHRGGLAAGEAFVVVGDLNASPIEGDAIRSSITGLIDHQLVNSSCVPSSQGGQGARPGNPNGASHTAAWGLRVDYVLPSKALLKVTRCGVFWPTQDNPLARLVGKRGSSSDHRLVWVDLKVGSN